MGEEEEESREWVCGGERRYVSILGPTMCLNGKKLTGRKESYNQPENQHRAQYRLRCWDWKRRLRFW